MNSHSAEISLLALPLVLLAAAVIRVPIARFLKLSAIVAYLVAGVVIGPYGFGIFNTPERILTVAELGVVMLLFLIGLELELSRLLAMRRDIFGLGVAQLALTAGAIAGLAIATGMFNWRAALVAGLALALSATSIALRILEDRGSLQTPYGQRAFAILLFQDMSVVPLLALVPLLASPGQATEQLSLAETASSVALIGGAIAALVIAGRYLLNPFFRLLAWTDAREVMTAAALLIVLGSALLMQVVGMSMALGAFIAGVLLAESTYRHELEADIEPFRGLLRGPPFAELSEKLLRHFIRRPEPEADAFDGASGSVLVIGFGRFGQIVSQHLLAAEVDVTAIDVDPEMIQVAARFGFKVYYGDGTRLDVLRAAGLDKARLIAICVDNQDDTSRIVDLTKAEFPGTKIFARSYDRGHTLQLLAKDVDYELRETFESAMKFGRKTLEAIGLDAGRADIVEDFIRTRDRDRIAIQQAEGIYASIDMLRQRPKMAPFSEPARAGRALNEETEEIIEEKEEGEGCGEGAVTEGSWYVTGVIERLFPLDIRFLYRTRMV